MQPLIHPYLWKVPWDHDYLKIMEMEMEMEMFYLTTHSTHFIYGCMASDIWLRTILIVREETRCRHIGYSFRLTARVLLYAPSHRQGSTYHRLCYTSRGALAGTRNSSPSAMRISNASSPCAARLTRMLDHSLVLTLCSQCSTTGVTKAVVCATLSVGWCI